MHEKPADYLESFETFIRERLNDSVALGVVVNRPRDLTRETLKEVRLLLDGAGYSEARLESAWRNATNQEIAASIVGHIRRAALGEALVPFEQRVRDAMQRIYALHGSTAWPSSSPTRWCSTATSFTSALPSRGASGAWMPCSTITSTRSSRPSTTPSGKRADMFKKRDFFDTLRGHVDGIDTSSRHV
ncbi:type I restriction-modification enzyme R subunit C-terminal domain-containing protein [Halomonas sp. 328]|uniref:type I restriction-modification enzyme R subunit C-terminal domain-containing protein n=1 Tax=Halomonas sp. 328 TaxID=2776704 RepID=UPI003FA39F2B